MHAIDSLGRPLRRPRTPAGVLLSPIVRYTTLVLLAATLTLTACGTVVYDHQIEIAIQDPSGRLGPPPIAVSVFDKQMGSSEEWAGRWMGSTGPGQLYVGKVAATGTKMFYDSTPPARVETGIALPSYAKEGFFVLDVNPVEGSDQTTVLPFVAYGSPSPSGAATVPLPARFRSEFSGKGWLIHLTVDVPPATNP